MPREHPRPGEAQARALKARQAAQDELDAARRAKHAPATDRGPARPLGPRAPLAGGALPDGAAFEARYNAQARRFDATLTLPGGRKFTARADGVYAALRELYAQYHQWLDAGSPPAEIA